MKIGVLGYGSIGERHAKNAVSLGHQVGMFDPIGMSGKIFDPNILVMDRKSIIDYSDAVVVASPSKCHAQDLMDVIHAGKHVLVEKPFGYDCPPLLGGFLQGSRSKNPDLIIATGFNLRFHHSVQAVRSILKAGTIGKLICASFTVNQKTTKPPYLMDGIIRNWMSHEIDLAHHLFGDGEVISCIAPVDSDGNDTIECHMSMDFPSVEQPVFLQGDYYTDPEQRFFWIEGEKGSIYCNLVHRSVYLRMKGENPKIYHTGTDTWDENYLDEMKHFICCVEGGHSSVLATGEDGVRALYTVMAARERAGI